MTTPTSAAQAKRDRIHEGRLRLYRRAVRLAGEPQPSDMCPICHCSEWWIASWGRVCRVCHGPGVKGGAKVVCHPRPKSRRRLEDVPLALPL